MKNENTVETITTVLSREFRIPDDVLVQTILDSDFKILNYDAKEFFTMIWQIGNSLFSSTRMIKYTSMNSDLKVKQSKMKQYDQF